MVLLRLQKSLDALIDNKLLYTKSIEKPTETVLEGISSAITELNTHIGDSGQIDPLHPLTFHSLQVHLKSLQTALVQGLPLLNLYSASPQGALNLDLLISGAARSTFEEFLSEIDPQVINDFDESGKCLAFALYTAAGYHAARACEGALRMYAEEFIAPEEIDKLKTMGAVIKKLKDVKGDAPPMFRLLTEQIE